jgi:YggT family protein
MGVLASYATFVAYVKIALLGAGAVLALVCVLDWAVRTRRISPFSGVARFCRARVDPLMAPVERVIVRSGGVPTAAPWWSLVALALFGILLISLLQFAGSILSQAIFALDQPSTIGMTLASWGFGILRLALLVRVISSWLPISPYSRWIRWSYVLTNWMITPLQRVIPRIGMIDITPIVAWILLNVIQGVFSIP